MISVCFSSMLQIHFEHYIQSEIIWNVWLCLSCVYADSPECVIDTDQICDKTNKRHLINHAALYQTYYLRLWLSCYYDTNLFMRDCITFVIQIKICAKYRDMLPRPRLVCQEPGLRPIGRSPGVPDKSSRGLGSMSRYSAQILICFIAYIFSISLWVWLGTLQNCHHAQCPLPLFIVIRMRLLSAHQTIKSPSMPCWGAAGRNTLWHSCHRTGEISR